MLIKDKHSFFDIIQLLSIDVVLGALAVGYLATKLLDVYANPYWWVILALSVWIIYTIDHIIDGLKNKHHAVIYRHRFHYENIKIISISVGVFSIVDALLCILFLDNMIIYLGMVLTMLVFIYFGIVFFIKNKKSIFIQKEIIIAFIYTSGIFLSPLVWYGKVPTYPALLVIFNIFMLAWLEGIIASWFDFENDVADNHTSFTVIFGKKNTRYFIISMQVIMAVITKISILVVTRNVDFFALMITILMDIVLLIIVLNNDMFGKNNLHKIVGESIFLLPILIYFV